MKKIILLLTVLFAWSINLLAQDAPAEIRSEFEDMFPEAENIVWEQEEKGAWEADFTLGDKKMSALFEKNGSWLETETGISMDEVPENITELVKKEFPGGKVREAETVERPDFRGYELEIEVIENDLKIVYEVYFTEDGEIVEKVVEDEEDDD